MNELPETIRGFLTDVFQAGGVEVKDDSGQLRGWFTPNCQPTPEEEKRADESLERLRRKAGKAMKKYGVTEEDIVRVALEDD